MTTKPWYWTRNKLNLPSYYLNTNLWGWSPEYEELYTYKVGWPLFELIRSPFINKMILIEERISIIYLYNDRFDAIKGLIKYHYPEIEITILEDEVFLISYQEYNLRIKVVFWKIEGEEIVIDKDSGLEHVICRVTNYKRLLEVVHEWKSSINFQLPN